MNDQMTSN